MFINCTDKCAYQKDGICTKNDCKSQNENVFLDISGSVSCPHYIPVNANNELKSSKDAEDHRHFSAV